VIESDVYTADCARVEHVAVCGRRRCSLNIRRDAVDSGTLAW